MLFNGTIIVPMRMGWAMATRQGDDGEQLFGTTVRVPKSAELVARTLRRQIVRGELREGDGLPPENVLMQQFGVSRPTLREAFRILESEQMITIRRGARGGARVHAPSGDAAARYAALLLQYHGATLRDICRAREVIEPACVRLLATRRTSQQLKALRAALAAEGERTGSRDAQASAEFHRLVVEMAGNQTLLLFSRMITHILQVAAGATAGSSRATTRRLNQAYRVHQELLVHIENKDADAAEQVWSKHLVDMQARLVSTAEAKTALDMF
jgi:DNA-binding FadR family transcriptional regulator